MNGKHLDEIKIEGLEVFAHHGVFEEEKKEGQTFVISATLYTDTRLSGRSDDLKDTVNYGDVAYFIDSYISRGGHNLLEKLANDLARDLLTHFNIEGLELQIEKPQAPIDLNFKFVAVKIKRFWQKAYLSLGSNMGDRKTFLDFGIASLKDMKEVKLLKTSSFYETKAYGKTDQEDFLNACLEIKTFLTAEELLNRIHSVETEGGRKREERWGPRTLDIDILLFGDELVSEDYLHIPHIDMHNRLFVLEPLAEIAPQAIHPIKRKSISDLLEDLKSR